MFLKVKTRLLPGRAGTSSRDPCRAALGLEPVLTGLGVSGVWAQRRTERLPGQPLVCGAAWQPEMPWPPWAQEAWGLPGVRGQEIRGDVDVAPACWYLSHRKTRPPWLEPVFAGSGYLWPNVSSWNYSSPGTIGGSKGVTLRRERNGLCFRCDVRGHPVVSVAPPGAVGLGTWAAEGRRRP